MMNTKAELVAKADATRAAARSNPSPENREAAVVASAELSAWITANEPPQMRRGRDNSAAARSGRRQWREAHPGKPLPGGRR